MIPDEDLQDMRRRHHQEHLLFTAGFAPVLEGGRELWTKDLELYTRSRALLVALEELAGGERGPAMFTNRLTSNSGHNSTDERGM